MILEVYLNDFVAKSKHNRMLGSHPFLDVNTAGWIQQLICLIQFISLNQLFLFLRIIVLFQIRFEVLKKCNLLLEFCREIDEAVLSHHVLLFICSNSFPLIIVELSSARLGDNFCRVIKENTC